MKKALYIIAAASLMVACDPVEEGGSFTPTAVVDSQLSQQGFFTFTQTDAAGNVAADGNFFTYTTNPSTIVRVYNYKADGSENQLALGSSGTFAIQPGRGSDPNQKFYVQVVNSDLSKAQAEYSATVFVKQELSMSEKLMASNSGKKVWKWDPSINGVIWGNMGYCGGSGADVALSGNGQWWGVTGPEDDAEAGTSGFASQLGHSVSGQLTGEESLDAYMVFTEDGEIQKYDKDGMLINKTTYELQNYDASAIANGAWKCANLVTGENSVLWPFEINAGGKYVTNFEVCYLTVDKMCLVYPDGGDFGSLGNWGEATFWHFASNSDLEGMAEGVDGNGKAWTWNTECPNGGVVWGNMGYCGGNGADVFAGNGKWWGVTSEAEFGDQTGHRGGDTVSGDESMDAYMIWKDGEITSYNAAGQAIRNGTYKFEIVEGNPWKLADLKIESSNGAILWPYEINSGGNMPSTYEVCYMTNSAMTLVYPDGGDFGSLGNWGEASFWQFKAK